MAPVDAHGGKRRARWAAALLVAGWPILAMADTSGPLPSASVAAGTGKPRQPAAQVAACLDAAAAHHRVDARLLYAIAAVESGFDPLAMGPRNTNATHDIGLMQINSSWLPRLATYGIDAARLREPCVSAHVGAWILADNIRRLGPVWRAVGAYNARTPSRQAAYVARVQRVLAQRSGVVSVP